MGFPKWFNGPLKQAPSYKRLQYKWQPQGRSISGFASTFTQFIPFLDVWSPDFWVKKGGFFWRSTMAISVGMMDSEGTLYPEKSTLW